MRRIVTIVALWMLGVAGFGATWIASGVARVPPRPAQVKSPFEELVADIPRDDPPAPLVVWVGDSTILPLGHWTYPQFVEHAFLAPSRVQTIVRAGLGFTFYQFYCLMSPIAAARPSVVVLVLNLRRMYELPRISPILCSRLSPAALLEAAQLPLGDIGMPFPRLLLNQLLRWPATRAASDAFDRVRLSAHATWANAWHGYLVLGSTPEVPRPGAALVAQWRQSAVERAASTTMLAATVRHARSSGAKVLVVVSPVPVGFLLGASAWDGSGYGRLIAHYRTVVEEAGGELVDLHGMVRLDGFRNTTGFTPLDAHLNSRGAVKVAAKLGPRIVEALGLPPR